MRDKVVVVLLVTYGQSVRPETDHMVHSRKWYYCFLMCQIIKSLKKIIYRTLECVSSYHTEVL